MYGALASGEPHALGFPCRLQGHSSAEESPFPGQAELEAFFAWLDLCDHLTKEATPVGTALAPGPSGAPWRAAGEIPSV